MTVRRPLLLVLAALPVLALLVALGTWQVQRLAWKTDLLARLDAAEAAPPTPLRDPPDPYARVAARGRFLHDREALFALEVRGPSVLGARLLTPLQREDGGPTVLVDRGWVPLDRPAASLVRPEGVVEVTGFVQPGERAGLLSARDDAAARRFYTLDPPEIGRALGLPGPVAPYALVAVAPPPGRPGAPPSGALPDPARSLPRPTNPHLGYAITWYGLALSLVGVVAAMLVAGRREAAATRRAKGRVAPGPATRDTPAP